MIGNALPYLPARTLKLVEKTILYALVALSFIAWPSLAQTLRVALTDNDYPPYYFEQAGEISGFSVEVLTAVAKDIGVELQWQRAPWSRTLQQLEAGHVDVITVLYKTAERQLKFGYSSQSYLNEPVVLLCAEPCQHNFDGSIASLGEVTIAIVRDFSYGPNVDQAQFNKVAIIESDLKLVRLLANKRLQYGLSSIYSAMYAFEREQVGNRVRIISPPLDYVDVYFGLSKKSGLSAELVTAFNQSLSEFIQTEHYQALLLKYQLMLR